MLDEIGDMSLI